MTSPTEHAPSPWIRFLAHLFAILVAWTIFIKYLFPIGFTLATYIYWDLWPVTHLWLAWALLGETVVDAHASYWHVCG